MLTEKDLLERLTSDYLSENDKEDLRQYFEYRILKKKEQYEQERLARTLLFEQKYPNVKEKIKQILSDNNSQNNAMKSNILAAYLKQFYNKDMHTCSLISFIRNTMEDIVISFKNELDDNCYYFYLKGEEV